MRWLDLLPLLWAKSFLQLGLGGTARVERGRGLLDTCLHTDSIRPISGKRFRVDSRRPITVRQGINLTR